jgi:hypothetical protein
MGLDSRLRKLQSVVGMLEELDTLFDKVPDWIEKLQTLEEAAEETDDDSDCKLDPRLSALYDEVDARLEAKDDDPRLVDVPILNPNWNAEVAAATAPRAAPDSVGSPKPLDGQNIDPSGGGDDPASWEAVAAVPDRAGSPIRPPVNHLQGDDTGNGWRQSEREWLAEKMADPVNHLEKLLECRRTWPAEFARAKAALSESKRVAMEALLARAAVPDPQDDPAAVARTIDPEPVG